MNRLSDDWVEVRLARAQDRVNDRDVSGPTNGGPLRGYVELIILAMGT